VGTSRPPRLLLAFTGLVPDLLLFWRPPLLLLLLLLLWLVAGLSLLLLLPEVARVVANCWRRYGSSASSLLRIIRYCWNLCAPPPQQ
jgi:hypothetical protein